MTGFLTRRTTIACATVIAGLLTATGCKKPQQASDTLSLDNFAAGQRVRTNVCEGNPAANSEPALINMLRELEGRTVDRDSDPTAKKANLVALKNAFSALPPFAQTQFLGLGGQVLLTRNVGQICGAGSKRRMQSAAQKNSELSALSEGFSSARACYIFANPGELDDAGIKSEQELYVLVIQNNATEIAHNLVRVFGYMHVQLSSRLGVTGDFTSNATQVALAGDENPEFAKARSNVARAFISDLSGKPSAKRFAEYMKMDPVSPGRIAFENYVYAEAFDSFFCNQHASGERSTLGNMRREFPKTLEAFLESLSKKDKGLFLADDSKPAASLGLWGPWEWAKEKYNGYVRTRDAMIEGMVKTHFEVSGGKPPGVLDTVSIAANAAWRPVADVPGVDKFVKPAVKFADGIGGATIDERGGGHILTDAQRARMIASGASDVALDFAGGAVADAAGKRMGALGAEKFGDAVFSRTGSQMMTEMSETALGRVTGRTILKYGDQAAEASVGFATNRTVDFVAGQGADAIGGAIAGPLPGSAPAPQSPPQAP